MAQSKSGDSKTGMPGMEAFSPFATLMPLQLAYMQAMTKAAQSMMDGMLTINRELMSFADERARALRDDTGTPAAGEPMAIWNQQVDRANSATQAYLQEASKLLELGMKVSQESWAPLHEQMSTALRNGHGKGEPPKADG